MAYALQSAIHLSIDGTTWYKLTDHNRQEVSINPLVIEKENRMANGLLRKFIVAKKDVISTSWDFIPAQNVSDSAKPSTPIVDGNYSASWLTSFYNANVGTPIFVKIIASKHTDPSIGQVPNNATYLSAQTGEKVYQAFITGFTKTVRKRTKATDYVDMTIEFTEI